MTPAIHRVPPCRLHNTDRRQMAFDLAGRDVGLKSGLVDQQGFVHEGSIWCQAVGWDLVFEDSEVFEGG